MKRIIRRRLKIKGQTPTMSATERATRQAVRYIRNHPHYTEIIVAIREGTPNRVIAEHGIEADWFDVNMKTAVSYLQYFRKSEPELCKPLPKHGPQGPVNDPLSYDHLFDGIGVPIDPKTEMLKLIRVQKARISIDFNNERGMNKLFNTTGKEVEQLRELLMEYARLCGLVGANVNVNFNGYDESVKADLQNIRHEEQQRAILTSVVREIAEQVSAS